MRDLALVIRDAHPDEYPHLGALTVAAFEEYRAGVAPEAWAPYIADLEDVAGRARSARTLVALAGGEPVGVVALFPPGPEVPEELPPGTAYIRALATDPARRGQGVGRALTQACIEAARAGGHRAIGLMTHEMMSGPRRLYEGLGFREIATLTWPVYGRFLVYLLPLEAAGATQP